MTIKTIKADAFGERAKAIIGAINTGLGVGDITKPSKDVAGAWLAGSDTTLKQMGGYNTENYDGSVVDFVGDHHQKGVEAAIKDLKFAGEFTAAQIKSAAHASIMAGSPRDALFKNFNQEGFADAVPLLFSDAVTSRVGGEFDGQKFREESYDESATSNFTSQAISYNLIAARQEPAAEAFSPTFVVEPQDNGFEVSVRIIQIADDAIRDMSGKRQTFNRKSLVDAYVNPDIIKIDSTKMYEIYRDSNDDNNNTAFFAPANLLTPESIVIDSGESIRTSALKIGAQIEDLIGMCQTPLELSKGAADVTDTIAPSVVLDWLYLTFTDAGKTDVVRIKASDYMSSEFTNVLQGMNREMELRFKPNNVTLNSTTKLANNGAPTVLSAISTNDWKVTIKFTVNGNIDLDKGVYSTSASNIIVTAIYGPDGTTISTTLNPSAAALKAIIESGTVAFHKIRKYRSNLNKRQRGQLINSVVEKQRYSVPLRGPITSLAPVSDNGLDDATVISQLATATHVATTAGAYSALFNAANSLSEYQSIRTDMGTWPDTLGIGRHFVKPTFIEKELVVDRDINSLTSTERAADLSALIVNNIREIAYRLLADSNWKASFDLINGGDAGLPSVRIITDFYTSRFISIPGDTRILGGELNATVHHTYNQKMKGKIFIVFIVDNEDTNVKVNAHSFMNMAWAAELTHVIPAWRSGAVNKEITVTPRFMHFMSCPVLGMINISGIEKVQSNVPVSVNNKVVV